MNYKYKPKGYVPIAGDIVVWTKLPRTNKNRTKDKPYIVLEVGNSKCTIIVDDNGDTGRYGSGHGFKVIETRPISETKVGDSIICIDDSAHCAFKAGDITTIKEMCIYNSFTTAYNWNIMGYERDGFVVLCQEETAEQSLAQPLPKVRDRVIALKETLPNEGNHKAGDIETITKVEGPNIWVSNTNGYPWTLGLTWKLYEEVTSPTEPPIKEQTMEITDHVINIEDTSLADRLRLRQVLLDNGQVMGYEPGSSFLRGEGSSCYYSTGDWIAGSKRTKTITLVDFIKQYSKQPKLHDLAFSKRDGSNWTEAEHIKIFDFVGDDGPPKTLDNLYVYPDMSGGPYYNWYEQKMDHCLKVYYEDVFPESSKEEYPRMVIEKPIKPEKRPRLIKEETTNNMVKPGYPIYKKWVHDDSVFKFTDVTKATCVIPDIIRKVGESVTSIADHYHNYWEDFDPTSSEGYNHQYNYFKSRLDKIDLSFLVHNNIVVKTFGSIPLAQAIVDRAHECGGYNPGDISYYICITSSTKCIGSNTSYASHGIETYYEDNDYMILTWEELLAYEDNIEEPEEIQLIKEEPMKNPFKKGDIVRVLKPGGCGRRVVGATHTVLGTRYDNEYIYYKPDFFSHYTNFELVEPAELIEVGSKWERKKTSQAGEAGEIITVSKVNHYIYFKNGFSSLQKRPFLERFKFISSPICASAATTETSETTTPKENIMTDISIKVNGQEINTVAKASKPKSDYKLRPAIIADYYSADNMLLETKRFRGKSANADAQAHLVTLIAAHPNAKVVPYTIGKASKIKHQFTTVS